MEISDQETAFAEAVAYLEGLRAPVAAPGLQRMRALVEAIGLDDLSMPIVHVTGTNGKGSVSRLIEASLRGSGGRTGLYTSPHLEHVSERIVIGGVPIDAACFVRHVKRVGQAIEQAGPDHSLRPTHFEALTAVGFLAFEEADLDALVLETGVGGEMDATNVAHGKVSVITNVELDHTDVLGETREQIAAHKAGIIEPGSIAIIGESAAAALEVILERCRTVGAVPWRIGRELALVSDAVHPRGRAVVVETPLGVHRETVVPFHGRHQAMNGALAIAALDAFSGEMVDPEVLAGAWTKVANPGRFEEVDSVPTVVIDVAHNPHGVHALVETLDERYGERRRVVVVGVNPHKDAELMLRELRTHCDTLIATEVSNVPAVPSTVLAKIALALGYPEALAVADPAEAVRRATQAAGPDDVIVLTGSHYWIGEVRQLVIDRSRSRRSTT